MTTLHETLRSNGQKPAVGNMESSLQLLSLIMNNIPQAVFWKDRNLVYLGCNQAFADDAGFSSPEELIGKTDFDMPWKDQAELYRADDRLVMESGESKLSYEEPQTTPNGSTIWLSTSKIPVHEKGQIVAVLGMYEDITSRKQAENALQQSEANLASALHIAQMGYWEFDIRTQLFTFNDQYYSLHGTTAQEVGGYQMNVQRFAQEFVHPEDAPDVGQATQRAIETMDPNFQVQIESRILCKNGEVRWMTVWFRIEKDAQGQTIKLHGVSQDITERKRAEAALKLHDEFSQRQSTIFAELARSDTLYSGDIDAAFSELTEVAARALHLRRASIWYYNNAHTEIHCMDLFEEDKGHSKGSVLTKADFPSYFKALEDEKVIAANNAHTDPATYEFSASYLTPLGINSMLDAPVSLRGEVIGVICHEHVGPFRQWTMEEQNFARMIADLVTTAIETQERKQAERALRQSEANLSSALHVAQMGYWEFDLSTQMFTLNDQYYALHGLTAEQMGGHQIHVQRFAQEFVYPEDAAVVGQATQAAIETTDPDFQVQTEARIMHADGKPRWVSVWFRVEKDEQGRTIKLHGVNQDITERKHLQDQIQTAFERRGRQVQRSTQVSQSIAAASSLEELYERVVTQVKEQFGYYHTQLLRYDAAQEAIVLVTGYGETGAKMLAAGHRLPMGEGLIGTAAATGETVLRSTLENDPNWQPHPLLPETKGEVAVPIKLENSLLGVLDVQSNVAGSLDADDQLLLEGLCGQIATAIESTRLRQEMTERLEEINRLYRAMSHEGWQTYRETTDVPSSFIFDQAGLRPAEDIRLADELFARLPLTVPGGEVIGTLAIADDPQRPISPDDRAFLEQVSEQVALALESARLFEQTQLALVESEEAQKLIRNVIDSTEDWIFVKDRQHRYQLVNRGYAKSLHIATEDFIGKNDLELGFPEELVKGNLEKGIRGFWADDQLVIETGMPQHFPDDPAMIDGQVHIFDTIKIPLRDASSNIWGVLAFARDLTDRKHAEEIIAQRATQLAAVANVSTTASTLLDPDQLLQSVVDLTRDYFGLYHTHIYLADESWQTLLLAAGAGEVGRQMVADGWNISFDHQNSIVADAARNRKPVIANDVVHDKDSSFLSHRLLPDTRSEMAVPIIVGEKLLGVFDVQSDKTAHFTDEDANIYITLASQIGVALQNARLYVEQAATLTQLRELDKLKSSFLANMSHELRTPLNSILGFTDVMLEGLDGSLTDYMDNDLRLIQKNGQHLLHLINDVLDMAKIEAGRMNLNPETFKVHEVLHEVTSITSTLANDKRLSLFIDDRSDQNIEIYADRTRFRQVMINLVNNAIKFTDQGQIALNVSPMDGARVLITVKDTGIGIPSDNLETIFQEFTQVDSSTTRKTGGTGLGLPISRRLVEMHGGRVWAESAGVSGEGSTLFVELPVEARITDIIEKQTK